MRGTLVLCSSGAHRPESHRRYFSEHMQCRGCLKSVKQYTTGSGTVTALGVPGGFTTSTPKHKMHTPWIVHVDAAAVAVAAAAAAAAVAA